MEASVKVETTREEMCLSIRDKIIKSYNPVAVILKESPTIFQDVVKAFVILDIADNIINKVDASAWKFTPKMKAYKQVVDSIHKAMILPYSRMTDEEVALVNDLSEQFYYKWGSSIEKLFYAIQSPLMDVDTYRRGLLCDILLVSVICEISRQVYDVILKVDIRQIGNASYYADSLVRMIYKDCMQTPIEDLNFNSVKMLADAKNALTNQFKLLTIK